MKLNNVAVLWWPFWKWRPVEIFRCQESIRDIIIYPHMKCLWNWTMLNLCGIVVAILKKVTGRTFFNVRNQFGTSLSTHISNFDDIGQCWFFAAILKMATARHFSMSGINSGHHSLPTYEMSLKSDNVESVRYCGGHFENGDRYKFFNVRNQFRSS